MQSWRRYHSLNHITDLLRKFNKYKDLLDLDETDSNNIKLSIWFHDIIYTPARPDNEEVNFRLNFREVLKYLKNLLKL